MSDVEAIKQFQQSYNDFKEEIGKVIVGQDEVIKNVLISNRTQSKIKKIKNNFPFIQEIEWGKLIDSDILINATSVGLNENDDLNIDLKSIKSKKLFYDVIYNPPQTKFLELAKHLGHNTLNGKSMFLYQAQKAFQIIIEAHILKHLFFGGHKNRNGRGFKPRLSKGRPMPA